MPRHLDEVLTQTKRFYTAKTHFGSRAAHFAVMHNGVYCRSAQEVVYLRGN